jgi:hypothetical protein
MIILPLVALIWVAEWGFSGWRAGEYHDARANVALSHAASAVLQEVVRFYWRQAQGLVAYPPPSDVSGEAKWSAAIEQRFGQPTAVFRVNGSDLRWTRVPENFRADSARLDQSVRVEENTENRGKRAHRDVGNMEVLHWSVPGQPSIHTVWMVGPKDSPERWGAVMGNDFWDTVARELERGDSVPGLDSPAEVLQNEVELSALGKQGSKPGLRIVRNGVVIFDSPGLDTTQYCYTSGSPDLTLKLYESKLDHRWALADRLRTVYLLFCAILTLAILVPIRRWYKKVMLLTEPENHSE